MDSIRYRHEMERKFNAVTGRFFLVFLGIVITVVLIVGFKIDPKVILGVAAFLLTLVVVGAMYWWNVSVLPKVRDMEQRESEQWESS